MLSVCFIPGTWYFFFHVTGLTTRLDLPHAYIVHVSGWLTFFLQIGCWGSCTTIKPGASEEIDAASIMATMISDVQIIPIALRRCCACHQRHRGWETRNERKTDSCV